MGKSWEGNGLHGSGISEARLLSVLSKDRRGIRGHMALSQPVFVATLNISPETVRAWEQGKRKPDGPTLRLLELAEQHPEVLLAKVRPSPTTASLPEAGTPVSRW